MTDHRSPSAEMRLQIAALGSQLRWGVDLLFDTQTTAVRELLVCGMGGSGITGDFLRAVAESEGRRCTVHKHYGIPEWAASHRPSVVVVSYSGNTAEALSSWEAAQELELPVAVITSGGQLAEKATLAGDRVVIVPGGYQPRSALGFGLAALLRVAAHLGLISDPRRSLEEAADLADLISGPKGRGEALAADLADGLGDRMVGIYGSAPLSEVAAYRWKTQINENAKRAAFTGALPEVTHNEIVGWEYPPGWAGRRVGIVALRDRHDHPGVARRFELLQALTAERVSWVGEVLSQGQTPLARLISLVAMGDLVSWELARRGGVDPMAVELIDRLKVGMESPESSPFDAH